MTVLPKIGRPPMRPGTRITAPKGDVIIYDDVVAPQPGWHHVILDGKPVVVAYCPKCLHEGYLDRHTIASDGTVSPSLICPHEGCEWHDTVRLENYEA